MKILKSVALILALILVLVGCGPTTNENKDSSITEDFAVPDLEETPAENPLAHFSAELFRRTGVREGNTLISPYSVANALALTGGGAGGETRAEFERLFAMDLDELHPELKAIRECYGANQEETLHTANNIWLNEDVKVKIRESFAQLALENYGAQIESIPFDGDGVKKINQWVDKNTNHMIPSIIDKLTGEDLMVLINALSLEAEWEEPYEKFNVNHGKFTVDQGHEVDKEFMTSQESTYLHDENTRGFIKPYKGGRFAFVALLPDEGIEINDYVLSFTEEKMRGLLESQEPMMVFADLPKFEVEDGLGLKAPLMGMGLHKAWESQEADFSKLAEMEAGELFMDRVIHKTFIQVNELGTKAGAATSVAMDGAALQEETKEVKLNRPFVYMIIDQETDLPIFMGKYVGE